DHAWLRALLADRDRLAELPLAQSQPPRRRIDEEPAQLGLLLRDADDGDTPDDVPLAFGDPEPVAFRVRAHELRQRSGDVRLEGRVEAVFACVEGAVQRDDGPQIARPEVGSQGDGGRKTRGGGAGGLRGLCDYPAPPPASSKEGSRQRRIARRAASTVYIPGDDSCWGLDRCCWRASRSFSHPWALPGPKRRWN